MFSESVTEEDKRKLKCSCCDVSFVCESEMAFLIAKDFIDSKEKFHVLLQECENGIYVCPGVADILYILREDEFITEPLENNIVDSNDGKHQYNVRKVRRRLDK